MGRSGQGKFLAENFYPQVRLCGTKCMLSRRAPQANRKVFSVQVIRPQRAEYLSAIFAALKFS